MSDDRNEGRAARAGAAGPRLHRQCAGARGDITLEVVAEAVRRHSTSLDDPGFCISCGCEADGVEPDARKFRCDSCGFPGVYGAEELVMYFI